MEKYEILPLQLIHEGTLQQENFFEPELCDPKYILDVHSEKYIDDLYNLRISPSEQRKTGFVHSKDLIERESRIMEGTRRCAELALDYRAALNIAGGTHHAFTDRGEGFCLMNDQAIAAKWLMNNSKVNKILIIDLDVHQGNGTAEIFQNIPKVFTFSMHGKNNYPLQKNYSDLDVELEDGIRDNEFLYLLESSLNKILTGFSPDFIFYQSGVDIIESDKLGRLGVSIKGCLQRDKIVFNVVKELNVPIVCSMGGGYDPEIKNIVESHANTFRSIQEILF